jgi:hypothetical protein
MWPSVQTVAAVHLTRTRGHLTSASRVSNEKHVEVPDPDAVLELHSSDQTLMGRSMRGCGVVVCEKGRATFARAVALVRDTMVARKGS